MLNPLEYKHDIASMPLRWLRESLTKPLGSDVPQAMIFGLFGVTTAAINLMPGVTLIHAGFRGERMFSHVTYARFNPWALPSFHYTQAASKAERIGGAIGGRIGGRSMLELARYGTPFSKGTQKAWQKAGAKAGVKLGARVGGRLIPGVGWALLAYDVYDIAYNRSLWGFDF